jgi:hypothetical protein
MLSNETGEEYEMFKLEEGEEFTFTVFIFPLT